MLTLLLALACGEDDTNEPTNPGDADGDGWLDEQDCAPDDPEVHPDADEVCDGIDNNCNGTIDGISEALDPPEWYIDADGDGYGLENGARARGCEQPSGFAAVAGDCDDFDPEAHPETIWYYDVDGDGYGDPNASTQQCEAPGDDWVLEGSDCYDGSAEIHPGADEFCDGVDTDCDGTLDEGDAIDATAWYEDQDGDGYGGEDTAVWACEAPSGYGPEGGDCDDTDPDVHPYSTHREVPFDGIDNDCDGIDWCTDLDCDGYADLVVPIQSEPDGYPYESTLYFGRDGYMSSASRSLETGYTRNAAHADLDGDGYQDVVFATYTGSDSYDTPSPIYWGTDAGPKTSHTDLATSGVMDVVAEDFDGDGYVDLAFASYYDGSYESGHPVYWGPDFDEEDRTVLPGGGAYQVEASDLDGDGYPELLFCSYRDSSDYAATSHIYWGSASGYTSEEVIELETTGCRDLHAEDLNGDGWMDVVVASAYSGSSYLTTSVVYWGTEHGPSTAYRDELPTYAPHDVEVADVDQDGWQDLVFGGYRGGSSWSSTTYTQVYYGSALGYSDQVVDSLSTKGVIDFELLDLDKDGWLELVTPTYYNGSSYTASSTIWWGSETGWSSEATTDLQTYGAAAVRAADIDGDGREELIFSGYYRGNWNNEAETMVYWAHDDWSEGEALENWGNYGPVTVVTRETGFSL